MQKRFTILFFSALSAIGVAQNVTSVDPPNPTRSGLVRVRGTDLGDGNGESLTLAGSAVHIARWTPTFIELYVPEQTPLGPNDLLWTGGSGSITLTSLNVTERSPLPGRLKWRFQAADQFITTRPALGTNGTIYAIGNYGHLYALEPNGALKWVRMGGFAGTASIGPDGTIYCGGGGGVQAFDPQGNQLWSYAFSTPLLSGPNVGPDGNIYAVDNSRWGSNVLGAMVFSPSGELLWSGGNYYERGANFTPSEIVFDHFNAYFTSAGSGTPGVGTPGLSAISLGGGQAWVNPDGVGRQPSGVGANGVAFVGTSTLERWNSNGQPVWARSLWDFGGVQTSGDVVAMPDGAVYTLMSNKRILGLNPNGSTRIHQLLPEFPSQLALRPDNAALVMQSATNFGQPNRLRAYSPTGSLLWVSEDLPMESGTSISIYNRMAFTPDALTGYFGTSGPLVGSDAANSYVYAFDAGGVAAPQALQLLQGSSVSGGLSDLVASDNQKLVSKGLTLGGAAPVQLLLTGSAPSTALNTLKFRLEASASMGNLLQVIELWDYVAGQYVQVDARTATGLDSITEATVMQANRFIQTGTRQVRARISYKPTSRSSGRTFAAGVDRAVWLTQ